MQERSPLMRTTMDGLAAKECTKWCRIYSFGRDEFFGAVDRVKLVTFERREYEKGRNKMKLGKSDRIEYFCIMQ